MFILWIAVDKTLGRSFSSIGGPFPQVFHTGLWTGKRNSDGEFGHFYTNPQALLLLLSINKILKSISFSKRVAADWKLKNIFSMSKEAKENHFGYNSYKSGN